jgi:adenylylsulfate kinase
MIYWFTGQPGHGKTVLAGMLKEYLEIHHSHKKVIHIDGDDLRKLFVNHNYSREGRETNIKRAQDIATFINDKGFDVVVSLVAPYRDLRETFKANNNVTEIYVHTSEERGREKFHVQDYEKPTENFIDMDTTGCHPLESLALLVSKISSFI